MTQIKNTVKRSKLNDRIYDRWEMKRGLRCNKWQRREEQKQNKMVRQQWVIVLNRLRQHMKCLLQLSLHSVATIQHAHSQSQTIQQKLALTWNSICH